MALSCPSCGTPHDPRNPGIVLIACDACGTTLYREGDLLRAGVVARLAEPRSALRVGATGTVGDRRLRLVGRVGFSWGGGRWDEWYAEDARTGEPFWLVEDARRYSLERVTEAPAGVDRLRRVGDTLVHQGVVWQLVERGNATCEGAEGQLPRPVQPREAITYYDLTSPSGDRRLLIEVDDDGAIEAFLGDEFAPTQVDFGPVPEPDPSTVAATADGATCRCPGCGAPAAIPARGEPIRTLSCAFCDHVFAPDGEVGTFLGKRPSAPEFTLAIGDRGTLREVSWEVVGRLEYRDAEGWITHEYLLWAEGAGYLWMEASDGNYVALRPSAQVPPLSQLRTATPASTLRVGDAWFRVVEAGRITLTYVDGALPWEARIGETHSYVDLIKPPQVASVEWSETEAECFVGEWLPPAETMAAFGASAHAPVPGFHPAQPNPWRPWLSTFGLLLAFAVFNCGIAGVLSGDGTEVYSAVLSPRPAPAGTDAAFEVEDWESEPFRLDPANGAVTGIVLSSPVNNAWAWVAVEIVRAQDADDEDDDAFPVGIIADEVSYYEGYEDGESWSEGARSTGRYVRTPPADDYILRVEAEGDSASPVRVTITQGAVMTWLLWLQAVVLMGLGGVGLLSYLVFEGRRIPMDSDDDDDDDED